MKTNTKEERKSKYAHTKRFLHSKRAQEEIFGFLLIVALIIVVGMLFLVMKKPSTSENIGNKQISNLLYSIIAYTSSYQNMPISELIGKCYECTEQDCEQCNTAKTEISDILDTSLEKGGFVVGNQLKGYSFDVFNSAETELFTISQGNLTGNMAGSPAIIHSSQDDLTVTLKFYY